jgi:hypothetical protein
MINSVLVFLLMVVNLMAMLTIAILPFTLATIEAIPILVSVFCVVMLLNYIIGKDI